MRQPHPWHSESRSGGGWFVKLSGEQHFLGKHPAGAAKPIKRSGRWNPPSEILAEYHKLMAVRDTASKSDYTLDNIIALYVEELEQENQALAKRYRQILGLHLQRKAGRQVAGQRRTQSNSPGSVGQKIQI